LKQSSLFPEPISGAASGIETKRKRSSSKPEVLPPGFRYQPNLIGEAEEQDLIAALGGLPLKRFDFHGYEGNRRVVSFGLRYDYDRRGVEEAEPAPEFLENLRTKVAAFAGCAPEDFRQVGINEYRPGAGIGWHRDKPQFGDVVGVSLGAVVKMRFRRPEGKGGVKGWARASKILEPRSVYLMSGESRRVWYHSIPPATELRYSIMFRTLAGPLELLGTRAADTIGGE
jgi:alkylated DNA repair dioxygenase AlkB